MRYIRYKNGHVLFKQWSIIRSILILWKLHLRRVLKYHNNFCLAKRFYTVLYPEILNIYKYTCKNYLLYVLVRTLRMSSIKRTFKSVNIKQMHILVRTTLLYCINLLILFVCLQMLRCSVRRKNMYTQWLYIVLKPSKTGDMYN